MAALSIWHHEVLRVAMRAKVKNASRSPPFGLQTSPCEREEPEAASHSIAVEFIVWNPPDRLIHTSCIGVKVRSLVSQPCYTYWERHPILVMFFALAPLGRFRGISEILTSTSTPSP